MLSTLKVHKKYVFVILLAGLFIYIQSLSHSYNLDDELVTINHPLTNAESGVQWKAIFNSPYSIEKFGYTYGYRPIVHLSFALEHAVFGESPAISHLFNLLIYLLTGIFLFYFLLSWLGRNHLFLAGLSVLLFMVHPLHVEVVASIKNRDELLAFLAAFISMHAYLKLMDKTSVKHLLLFILFATIALLSKKTAIPILLLVPLIDVLYYQRWKLKSFMLFVPIILASFWVGLDFEWNPFLWLSALVLPLYSLLFILFVYREKWMNWFRSQVWLSYVIHSILACVIVLIAFRVESYFLLVSMIPLIWSIYVSRRMISIIYVLSWIVSGALLQSPVMLQIALMASFFLFEIGEGLKNRKNGLIMILILLSISIEFYLGPSVLLGVRQLSMLLIAGLFAFDRLKLASLSAFIFFSISTLVFGQLNVLSIFILVYIGLMIMYRLDRIQVLQMTKKWFRLLMLAYLLLMLVVSFVLNMPSPQFAKHTIPERTKLITLSNTVLENNGVKEGRQLEFVENPLIYPHYKQEEYATGINVIGTYLQLEFLPYPLRYYYGYKTVDIHSFKDIKTYLWFLVLISLVIFAVLSYRKQRLVSVSILFMLLPLILASNVFTLVAGVVAERHAYASTLGLTLLISLGCIKLKLTSWSDVKKMKWPSIVFVGILGIWSIQSMRRVGDWANPIKLMEHDEPVCQSSAHANSLLATSYIKAGTEDLSLTEDQKQERISQAIVQMKKAIAIFPYLFNYHFDLGRFYVLKGDYFSAFEAFKEAHLLVPKNPLALDELVKCSFDLNRTDETLLYGERLLKAVGPQEKTIELMAFQALRNQQFQHAEKWAVFGRKNFPNNLNFPRLIVDARAKKIIAKN